MASRKRRGRQWLRWRESCLRADRVARRSTTHETTRGRRGRGWRSRRSASRWRCSTRPRTGGGRGARPVGGGADPRAAPYPRWAARGMVLFMLFMQ
eukprot:scaffold67259_cov61-Phaeocystis_antarctica.AAC.3